MTHEDIVILNNLGNKYKCDELHRIAFEEALRNQRVAEIIDDYNNAKSEGIKADKKYQEVQYTGDA